MITLKQTSKSEIVEKETSFRVHVPHPVQYFLIMKGDKQVGFFMIEEIDQGLAEVSLEIFDDFKNKTLNKNIIFYLMNYPFYLGFQMVIAWTKRESLIKLFKYLKRFGVACMGHELESGEIMFEWHKKIMGGI
jgi:hypothetical protein